MIKQLPLNLTVLMGSFLMALIVVAASLMGLEMVALALPVAMAGGLIVFFNPYFGLVFIAFFVQLDALLRMIPQNALLTPEKTMTFVALAGLIITGFRSGKKTRWGPPDPLIAMAVMFGLTVLVSFMFVKDLEWGIWSVRKLLSLLALLYLTFRVIDRFGQVKLVLLLIILSSLISSTITIADYTLGTTLVGGSHAATTSGFEGVERSAGGSDYNPTTAATMNLAGVSLALILFLRSSKWRILTGPTVLVGTFAIILSFARSSAVIYVLLVFWLLWKVRKHRYLPAALLLLVILGIAILPVIPEEYWDRLLTMAEDWDQDRSITARITYNTMGLEMLASHPVLGIGPGQFRYYYSDPKNRFTPATRLFGARQLHNMYLEVGTENGLVGLFLFCGMVLWGGICLDRVRKHGLTEEIRIYGEAFHYSYVGFMAVSVFMPNEYNKYVWIFMGLAVAFARVAVPTGKPDPSEGQMQEIG